MTNQPSLGRECAAELLGTFFLVFFGTGVVFVAVLTPAISGLFQVAIVWGLAIALAIYSVSAISGAHINPAITIASAVLRGFPARKVLPYAASQLAGAFLASAVLFGLFSGILERYEEQNKIIRSQPGSGELSAMVFGEYFPNPGLFKPEPASPGNGQPDNKPRVIVSHTQAMAAEAVGTALLAFFVFALTDTRNRNRPGGTLFALFIGLTVSILIAVIAPLTQAGFNPARDFGPRLFAYFNGWGQVAIPGPRGGFFTVYILSPIVGAIAGGLVYDLVIRPGHAKSETAAQAEPEAVAAVD